MRQFRLSILLSAALSFTSVLGQSAYKGQLRVSDEHFSVQGDLLRVHMKVSYDNDVVNKGETLLFTPVLKTADRYAHLTSVAVSGDSRERYEQRTDRLRQRRRINVPVVTRDAQGGSRSFVYDTTVPWQSWMAGASLYAVCEESSWQGRDPHSFEDLLLSRLPLGAKGVSGRAYAPVSQGGGLRTASAVNPSWVQFLAPPYDATTGIVATGSIQLPYDTKLRKKHYQQLADSVAERIGRMTAVSGRRLISVDLTGYGAPIGNRLKNERRAADQTLRLKQALTDRRITGQGDLRVAWVAEDWDSISRLVGDAPMTLRAATLDIIRSIDVTQGREQALQTLGSGSAYSYLQRSVFPRVCRLSYSLRFSPQAAPADMQLWRNMPSVITPDNFYATALAYEKGSEMFCDIIDLAGRLFPDCAEAAIDAAAVAILKGDASRARTYIEPWQTDPRAYCNMGLLYLLEGNTDKAEVYLRMADAQGVGQALEALRHLTS